MAFFTETFSSNATLGEKFAAFVAQMQEAGKKRVVYHQTLRELSSLSTRELSDLGIARSMIRRLAYEAAYEAN